MISPLISPTISSGLGDLDVRSESAVSPVVCSLDSLRPGDCARVVAIRGDDAISRRLAEMGLIRGMALRVVRYAPLRDPMEVEVGEYRLALRRSEAGRVEVERDGKAKAGWSGRRVGR